MSKPAPFPDVKEIAAAKKLAASCRHPFRATDFREVTCLACGAKRVRGSRGRWIAPIRIPRLRRVK
jgi:hypothetical protein